MHPVLCSCTLALMANHDATYKFIFKHPALVRELILGYVEDDWLKKLDYSSLELVSGQFVSEELGLRLRNNDIIWRLQVDGDWVYIYLLLEFQRTVDRFMALRITAYLSLLYQDLVRQKVFAKGRRLPPCIAHRTLQRP